MLWEWDGDAHDGVAKMWMLMKRISDCREVVYSKWYQGRATFFAQDVFTAFLSEILRARGEVTEGLSSTARQILEVLEGDSPLSTKQLKKMTELTGRDNESQYSRAMKELFSRFLIVAYGEVEDGAFPSLALGATRTLYEDLWLTAANMSAEEAAQVIAKYFDDKSLFLRFLRKQMAVL